MIQPLKLVLNLIVLIRFLFVNMQMLNLLKLAEIELCTQTCTDADYTNDLVLLANTPVQTDSLLHNLKQAARGIGLYMNSEFMHFNQDDTLSSLNDKPLILVDQFTYLGSNTSSTENDVNVYVCKA